MGSESVALPDWSEFHLQILQLEQEGMVTRTFRRLDPERQQAILAAILDEAAERGPAAITIKRVAERGGVSVGSLYTYFGSRDGLLEFAIELCTRYMVHVFEIYLPYLAAMPLHEALAAYLTGGMEWSRTQTSLVRFFARAAYQGDEQLLERMVLPVATRMREMISAILAAAAARGETRPDLDLETVSRIVHALMIAVGDSQLLPYLNTYLQVSDGELADDRLLHALLGLIVEGIGRDRS